MLLFLCRCVKGSSQSFMLGLRTLVSGFMLGMVCSFSSNYKQIFPLWLEQWFQLPFSNILMYLLDLIFLILAAVEFLRHVPEGKYDAIIVDSSDPVGTSFSINFLFFFSRSWVCGCVYCVHDEGWGWNKNCKEILVAKYVFLKFWNYICYYTWKREYLKASFFYSKPFMPSIFIMGFVAVTSKLNIGFLSSFRPCPRTCWETLFWDNGKSFASWWCSL